MWSRGTCFAHGAANYAADSIDSARGAANYAAVSIDPCFLLRLAGVEC
jgi:hypothetical protein